MLEITHPHFLKFLVLKGLDFITKIFVLLLLFYPALPEIGMPKILLINEYWRLVKA